MEAREPLMLAYLAGLERSRRRADRAFFVDHATYEDTGAGVVVRGREEIRDHVAGRLTATTSRPESGARG